jgi:LAGLIDADG endonuclease
MLTMTYKNQQNLGSYLAGLWEGDGHVVMPKTGYRPSFHITFHINELPLAEKLLQIIKNESKDLKAASIRYKTKENACVLNVISVNGLELFTHLINGKLRSPKHHELGLVIDYLNEKRKAGFKKLKLAGHPLSTDAWLAGYIDADGSFGIRDTQATGEVKRRVACRFRLEQRRVHPKTGESYEPILTLIASYGGVKLTLRQQRHTQRSYYLVTLTSARSKKILRSYLDKFPLLTSKRLDYQDWCLVDDLIIAKSHHTTKGTVIVNRVKNGMNSYRTHFNWDHLKKL